MKKGFNGTIDVIRGLLKGRADSYEIFLSTSRGLTVEVREGKVDALRVHSASGAGLRTVMDKRPGFGFSSVLTEDALGEMVSLTVSGSTGATADGFVFFPLPSSPVSSAKGPLDTVDPAFDVATEDENIGRALSLEKEALGLDQRVKRVRKASYSESTVSTRTVNSAGVDAAYSGTFFSGSVVAIAEEAGEQQMGWDCGMGHRRADVDCLSIAKAAAQRAVGMLGARPIGTVKCPAVFENTVAIEFLEALSSSFLADNVLKGKSMLADKKGKMAVSPVVSIVDDGLMPGGWSTSLYDCEGVPRQKTFLVKEGVCAGFLYDTYWARRAGIASTGNAQRGGFKGTPSVGISNLYIEKGKKPHTSDELLTRMGSGLFITDVMGAHTIDPVSGEFSLGASGFWVEGGRPVHPVRGIAIAGTLLELFSKVEVVGTDTRFLGSTGSPGLLFKEINASGA
ncbi:MAG: TldD/PmbA family protein [Deltaproteobacteria bacterium]|nr:TldD/PmbA family protein [Deltaproteobacteria bacterium]